ncbi:hypothetical protein P153DRAFT_389241 [Dothidotthia symphoricarpi CBS 119687]|uniref:Uncharacterized protein n=1 Tax=Dothidotthia symphoricarpi CBS 119687 TaxID=1392245 RepID=A0A6A6A4F2_9PLEO|nr:uncharacterized protein P153DRAFT_389241 [Dothidotthia symphoricarpi CBS 119687]KAF2125787.1 hypothetical protein P153DRAFT_389241 [Dothidotthia symphoricarpi CBS 119687]
MSGTFESKLALTSFATDLGIDEHTLMKALEEAFDKAPIVKNDSLAFIFSLARLDHQINKQVLDRALYGLRHSFGSALRDASVVHCHHRPALPKLSTYGTRPQNRLSLDHITPAQSPSSGYHTLPSTPYVSSLNNEKCNATLDPRLMLSADDMGHPTYVIGAPDHNNS